MQNQPTQVNDILNYLNLQDQTSADNERMDEINSLLTYSKELEKQELSKRGSGQSTFMVAGIALLASTALMLIPATATGGAILGIGSLIFAVIYALGRLSSNSLSKLEEKMEKMHARLVKPVSSNKKTGIYKSKRDRIIAGVASGIARKMGISPIILRLLFLASIPATGGGSIALYLILAVILSFSNSEEV
jgi:phage shock protein PspC (stress-responsive transcriptional regulator)